MHSEFTEDRYMLHPICANAIELKKKSEPTPGNIDDLPIAIVQEQIMAKIAADEQCPCGSGERDEVEITVTDFN